MSGRKGSLEGAKGEGRDVCGAQLSEKIVKHAAKQERLDNFLCTSEKRSE